MMRRTLVLGIVLGTVLGMGLVASAARADAAAVEAVVRKNIVELGKLADDDELGFAADAIVISEMGSTIDLDEEDGCVTGAVANAHYGCMQSEITHEPGAIALGVDDARGIAWFQAPYIVTFTGEDDAGRPRSTKQGMRVGGVLARRGASWQIVAAMYVSPISDKALLADTGGTPAEGPPRLVGDAKLAGVVTGWFTSGFAPAAARTGTLIASGTSPREFKSGAAAAKLAKSWDKLRLGATRIEAQLLADGAIGWVRAEVMMPRKRGKGAIGMSLVAVVVRDGAGWRWVSLQYQPAPQIGH